MPDETVARRYAAAFFQQAKAQGQLDTVTTDLRGVTATLKATPDLLTLIRHPLVTGTRKRETLDRVFGGKVSPLSLALMNLLVDKRRSDLLTDVQEEMDRLLRAEKGIVSATALSAVPLTKTQLSALEKKLEARTGKDIELTTRVDPSLIGGVLVRIGDTVFDGSVRGQLERLREQLTARK